ncbi:transglutaminase-like domain-containing protein [Ruminococcus gauvreauii]|uniref:Transglutaminase-like domain-containing protein n=1 Tax=Ruminococcus gauvreauii TaxID=438033 RepID=A0ABY5VBU4_9FIRM|nr:transglutaminase-like domain-containing protein [Ruminococcus gauvreauii]UWP57970.1 transglutaminase-like domain-containing protein [Ruminococcus gauvreauii]
MNGSSKRGGFLAEKKHKNKSAADPGIEIWEDRYRAPQEKTGLLWAVFTFFSYVCGVLGILYALTFILILTCRQAEGALIVTAVCGVIWVSYFGRHRHPILTRMLAIAAACAAVYYVRDVQHQLGLLIQISRGEAAVPDRIDLTETLVLLGILCGILLFWLIFIVRKAWIFYFFSIPIVFGGPLLGQVLDVTEICLFAFFHMGTSVMGSIASDRRQPSPNVPGSSQTAAAGRCVALLGVFSMVFLLTAQLFTAKQMERLLAIPAKAEGYVRQTVSEMFVDSERNGDISRSNSYPSGKGQMELVLTAKPEENLYLKGFTGSAYVNGSWNSADETQFLEAAARESGQDPGELRDRFENRKYYLMQSATGGQGQTLSVQYVNQNETKTYLPPVSRLQEHSDTGYTAQMYEEQEFEDTISGMQAESWPEYLMLEDRYRQYAAETYLEVPDDGFSRLKTLCDEHPMTNYEGITEFILGTLHTTATYTLTPGVAPYGQDAVEYFLLEKGSGYCQHFASAAVLMYRYYNIPARYVTGYLAKADAFTQQEDGSYRAVLDDGSAHAWAEVYLAGRGWVVVEATPPGSVVPAESVRTQGDTAQEEQQVQNTPEATKEPERPGGKPDAGLKNNEGRAGWKTAAFMLGVLAAVCAAAVCMWKYLVIRRRRRKHRYRRYRADRLYARVLEVLHFGGLLKEYDGTEKGFPDALAEAIPDISRAEAYTAVQTVFREAFGPERISRKDTDAVLVIYEKTCRHVCRSLWGFKKWYFQYGKVYW